METAEIALLTRDDELADLVLSAAAAAGVRVGRAAGPQERCRLLLVGADAVAECERAGTPAADEVVLLGEDVDELARGSMSLGARVLALPEGRPWLTQLLAAPGAHARGRVIGLVGASGGVGTSTTAAALALSLAGAGRKVALVDADAGSGGIDLLLGAEAVAGWRWPALLQASGEVGDLRGVLVSVDGVDVVSQSRDGEEPSPEAVRAVVRSLTRTHDVVVVDAGRGESDVLALCERVVLVAAARVTGVAAAVRAARRWRPPGPGRCGLLLREGPLSPDEAATAVGLPLWGRLPEDRALPRAAEEGVLPGAAAGRAWRRGLAALVAEVMA